MNVNPTKSRRTVVLNIETAHNNQTEPNLEASADDEVITGIHIVEDGAQVTETSFAGAAEINLLGEFWGATQTDDVFFGYEVVDRLALLRRRTWVLDLVPSRDLDLRTVYGHDTVDTAAVRSSTGGAGYCSAQALASVLGLGTKASKARERLFVTHVERHRSRLPGGAA
jgi:hypothetical protein